MLNVSADTRIENDHTIAPCDLHSREQHQAPRSLDLLAVYSPKEPAYILSAGGLERSCAKGCRPRSTIRVDPVEPQTYRLPVKQPVTELCARESSVKVRRPIALPGVELMAASYRRRAFPRHAHEEYVIKIMLRGTEILRRDNREYVATRGSLVLLSPGEAHANWSIDDEEYAYLTCYVPSALMCSALSQFGDGLDQLRFRDPVVDNSRVVRHVLGLSRLSNARTSLENESVLTETLAAVADAHAELRAPVVLRTGRISVALDFLHEHYTESVKLAQLAALTGLAPYHFLRTFRREVGLPPAEYQLHLRLRRAKALIREGVPIAAVAADVGFADQSHLTRRFQAIVGMGPGAYARGLLRPS